MILDAIAVLKHSGSLSEATKRLRVSAGALRAAFQRARGRGLNCKTPREYVGAGLAAKPATGLERILVCPDVHIPFHDELAWATFLQAAKVYKPDHLIFLGDVADCYEVSDFTKSPDRRHNFKSEIRGVNVELDRVSELEINKVTYILGNHEDRLDRLIAKRAPELHGITSIPELLVLDERGWDVVPYGEEVTAGKIHFSHDYGPSGGRAVSQSLAATGHCVLFGHTHRAMSEYSGTTDGERHVGMSCGWLGDYNALAFAYTRRWKARKEWTHGLSTVEVDRESGFGSVQFHPVMNGSVIIHGQKVAA